MRLLTALFEGDIHSPRPAPLPCPLSHPHTRTRPTITHTTHAPPPQEVLRLLAGQFFGERALLSSARRAANVVACGRTTLLTINKERFDFAFGPLEVSAGGAAGGGGL